MTTADLDRQLANARDYWLGWGAADRSDGALTLYRSSVAHPQLNGVLRVSPHHSPQDAMAEAEDRLAGVPHLWWAGPDSRPDLADHLLAAGLTESGTVPIMSRDLTRPIQETPPPGLRIHQLTDLDPLSGWVHTYAPSFGVTPDQYDQVLQVEHDRPDKPGALVRFAAH